MGGSSPQATPIQLSGGTPPKPPPGYGPVRSAFEQVFPQLFNMALPSFQGQVDPGLSPTMQNLIRGAQSYSQSPFPQSLEQASGTLGAFQNFDKLPGSNRPYEFDPSHQKMYQFQNPFLPNPQQGQGPPPQYGFSVQPRLPGMAEGGAGGYGAGKIVKMAGGGGGGFGYGIPGWSQMTPGFNGQPYESDGYWWAGSPNGPELAFNPNPADARMQNSMWGRFWNWAANRGGFTPGQQHGPNAEFWDANPPSGYEGGRSGPIDPTDPADPHRTPYGWWTADPNQLGGGQQMPPWLSGLNDEQMAHVFDLVGNVPEGMEQPWDWIGEQLAAEGLIELPGPNAGSRGGGGRGGGGGGGGVSIPFSGAPGYNPVEVNPSFVGWDPGNPTPSMVPGNNIMPPRVPPPMMPPMPPPGGGGGNPGGGGGGGRGPGGPGGGRPAPAMSPDLPAPPMPMPFSPIHRGPGGGGGMGFRPGGGDPGMGLGNEVAIPMFAKGNVVDHPQLALIGEAGPEVVMPLTRRAAHPGIQRMQDQLGLPAKPMQTGGAAGMGGNMLQRKPAQMTMPGGYQLNQLPARMPGKNFPGAMPSPGGLPEKTFPGMSGNLPMGNLPGLAKKPGQMPGAMPGGGGFSLNQLPAQMPGSGGGPSMGMVFPGMGFSPGAPSPGGQTFGWGDVIGDRGPGGAPGSTGSQSPFQLRQLPAQMPGKNFPGAMPGGDRTAPPGVGPGAVGGNGNVLSIGGAGGVPQVGSGSPWGGMSMVPNPYGPGMVERSLLDSGWTGDTSGMQQGRGGNPGGLPQPGGLPGQTQPWQPQQNGMPGQDPFGPTSAMDVYRASVPVMNQAMEQAISGAMAQSGISGNRFSTSALNNAGRIGQEAGMAQNQLMSQLLYDQTNQDLNRSLQATGMGLEDARFRNQLGFQGEQNALDRAMQAAGLGGQFGQMQDQMMQDRLRLPFQIGAWEQGRQDQYARMPYDDFMQSRMGYLPYLFDLMASQGGSGGMSPQFGVQQTGGSPGALDYISALAPIFMGMMAEGGAAGSGASRYLEGGY